MSNENYDIERLLMEIKNVSDELKHFENNSFNVEDKIIKYGAKIDELSIELIRIKEIINKYNEFILLELESSLDKHEQIRIKHELVYDEFFNFLKKCNYDEIFSLKKEIKDLGKKIDNVTIITNLNINGEQCAKIIAENKNKLFLLNKNLKQKNVELSKKEMLIQKQNEELNELKKIITEKDNLIKALNNDIYQLKNDKLELDFQINELNEEAIQNINKIKKISDENKILKLNAREYVGTIQSLKEEITILKSTINEKNETLNYINEEE